MDLGLGGKSVIVTGGAKGIGYEIAKSFLREGCKVLIVDIDEKQLELAEVELNKLGTCIVSRCDVTNSRDVETMVSLARETFGTVDVLINNAGVLKPSLLEDMSEELWDFTLNVNLKSTFLCSKYAYEVMKEQGHGVIINASSFSAVIPSATHSAYAAAKSGVLSLTKTCAAEFAPGGVRVNAYVPGVVATHLTAQMRADSEKAEELLNDIPLRRFAEPHELADILTFIASPKCSYVNGAVIEIHGGKLCVQDPSAAYATLEA